MVRSSKTSSASTAAPKTPAKKASKKETVVEAAPAPVEQVLHQSQTLLKAMKSQIR